MKGHLGKPWGYRQENFPRTLVSSLHPRYSFSDIRSKFSVKSFKLKVLLTLPFGN